jgi:hypothetical protein
MMSLHLFVLSDVILKIYFFYVDKESWQITLKLSRLCAGLVQIRVLTSSGINDVDGGITIANAHDDRMHI